MSAFFAESRASPPKQSDNWRLSGRSSGQSSDTVQHLTNIEDRIRSLLSKAFQAAARRRFGVGATGHGRTVENFEDTISRATTPGLSATASVRSNHRTVKIA